MKLRLRIKKENVNYITEELTQCGIEIDEQSPYILTEEDYQDDGLRCKLGEEIILVSVDEICHIESLGREVYVHTMTEKYKTNMRLYQLEQILPSHRFLRISNSVIIQKNAIKKLRPGLSCKFYLTLKNGSSVDVTRTYYYRFKEYFGI